MPDVGKKTSNRELYKSKAIAPEWAILLSWHFWCTPNVMEKTFKRNRVRFQQRSHSFASASFSPKGFANARWVDGKGNLSLEGKKRGGEISLSFAEIVKIFLCCYYSLDRLVKLLLYTMLGFSLFPPSYFSFRLSNRSWPSRSPHTSPAS